MNIMVSLKHFHKIFGLKKDGCILKLPLNLRELDLNYEFTNIYRDVKTNLLKFTEVEHPSKNSKKY